MKAVNKLLRLLALVLVLTVTMATVAFAAETGKVWIRVTESSNGKDTVALIITDTTVTDGLVKVTYDPEALTYKDVKVDSKYVAMHSVNAEEAGTVLIAWVAPEAYEADGSALTLIEVTFEGVQEENTLEATGVAQDAEGNEMPIGTVDTSALEEAIAEAEELKEEDYTKESWKALEEELKEAEKVLEDPAATQEEIDAAAEALQEAIAALEEKVVDKSELEKAIADANSKVKKDYTKKSWDAMKAALKVAEKVMKDEDATQEEVDAAADALNKAIKALVPATGKNPETGDDSQLVLVAAVGALALIGVAALIVLNKKKGGK